MWNAEIWDGDIVMVSSFLMDKIADLLDSSTVKCRMRKDGIPVDIDIISGTVTKGLTAITVNKAVVLENISGTITGFELCDQDGNICYVNNDLQVLDGRTSKVIQFNITWEVK